MKIAVVGLGAVGGLIGAELARAGHEVSGLARGATLAAVQQHGLRLRRGGNETTARIATSDDARHLGRQQLVILALKGPALTAAAATLTPLIGPDTLLLPAMNGVPWWFLQTGPMASATPAAPDQDRSLPSVDPDGRIARHLPLPQVLGCVVHLTSSCPEPGVVQHGFGDRLIVGEPAGGPSARSAAVCAVLTGAGFAAEASEDVRREIWFKLWGNMTMNPVSALAGATCDRILDDPLLRSFMLAAMAEAAAIGECIGCPIHQSGEARLEVARQLGAFRTSMLQDLQAGRPLEIDALVGAVHEIAARVGVATPHIGALLGLTRLMARERGLYPA